MKPKQFTRGLATALFALLAVAQANAAGTAAGTLIGNTATATFQINGNSGSATDTEEFNVDELVDVDVTGVRLPIFTQTVFVSSEQVDAVTAFDVTNIGNGTRDFTLGVDGAPGGGDFGLTLNGSFIVVDDPVGGTVGEFDAGDTVLAGSTLTLAPDVVTRIFILGDVPVATDGQTGVVRVTATDNGDPAAEALDEFGAGTGAFVNLVLGASGGTDFDDQSVTVAAVQVLIDKSVLSVDDQLGGSSLIPGAIVTYQIAVNLIGPPPNTVDNLVIEDNFGDANLRYVKSSVSVQIDGGLDVGQSDASDGDFTEVAFAVPADASLLDDAPTTGNVSIDVNLGTQPAAVAPGTEILITLKAEIQ